MVICEPESDLIYDKKVLRQRLESPSDGSIFFKGVRLTEFDELTILMLRRMGKVLKY